MVGHGSRLPYSRQVVEKIAEYVEEMGDFETVEVGFMELCEPTVQEAVKKAAESGVDKIVVVPVFLAHGVHTKRDIPKMLGWNRSGTMTKTTTTIITTITATTRP